MKLHTKIKLGIISIMSYTLCAVIGIFFFIPILIAIALLPLQKRLQSTLIFKLLDILYRNTLRAMFIPVKITGIENITHLQQAIFVANHESSLDIPALGLLMQGHPHIWYVFDKFAKTPILGFFVRRMSIIVNQDSPRQSATALLQGMRLTQRYHLHSLIFPEGGRFNTQEVHDFFYGFAMLAKRTGQPVIPVKLYNLGKVYPPKSFFIYAQPIFIHVGTPLQFQPDDTEETFTKRVRQWFIEHKQ